jgi:hypothetical protein
MEQEANRRGLVIVAASAVGGAAAGYFIAGMPSPPGLHGWLCCLLGAVITGLAAACTIDWAPEG